MIALVFGASSVVVELRSDLNTIWRVLPSESMSGMKALVAMGKERFVCLFLIVAAGFLVLFSLVASTVVAAAGRVLGPNLPVPEAPEFPAGMVGYVAMVASLIEGRPVSEEEIVRMLVRAMRQHSMARRRRVDYVVTQLNKHGP